MLAQMNDFTVPWCFCLIGKKSSLKLVQPDCSRQNDLGIFQDWMQVLHFPSRTGLGSLAFWRLSLTLNNIKKNFVPSITMNSAPTIWPEVSIYYER